MQLQKREPQRTGLGVTCMVLGGRSEGIFSRDNILYVTSQESGQEWSWNFGLFCSLAHSRHSVFVK